jgi:hypothetical protein
MKPLMRDIHNSNATSSLSGPNILISTLLSNILHLLTSFRVRDQVSHTKYIEIYIVRRMNGTIFLRNDKLKMKLSFETAVLHVKSDTRMLAEVTSEKYHLSLFLCFTKKGTHINICLELCANILL